MTTISTTTEHLARRVRIDCLQMTSRGRSSHIGSAFSCADILAVLYGSVMRVDPARPSWPDRDRFILSKGHAGSAVYAVLAECGFFPREKLLSHYQDGSDLSGHVSHKGIPGVELSTGSLGHGLGIACGLALAAKRQQRRHHIVALLSDGECDEGSTWEAVLFAAHHGLDNLTAVIDYNKIQSLGPTEETLRLEPFTTKWRSFGWEVREVDGHDHRALHDTLSARPFAAGRPSCVVAHTIKGKGVTFMEHSVLWHYRTALAEEFDAALAQLEGKT